MGEKNRLKDKVAIITGAGSGIGRAAAILFSEEGAKVMVADIVPKGGKETVNIISEKGGKAFFINADVACEEEVKKMVGETIKRFGKIDILYNNAGYFLKKPLTEFKEEEWDKILDVNLKSIFLCSKHVVPEMIKVKGGCIVNTSSIVGLTGTPFRGAYAAAKAGVIALTMSMAAEFAPYNIRVNAVCPGNIDTPMAEKATIDRGEVYNPITTGPPGYRAGKPEELASAALFLVSDESSFVSGTNIYVGGSGPFSRPPPLGTVK